ncbi:hypothetical protein [Hyphomicrobium sp.]|uniref:hypothetical protein n=1 Tax=Hyphomicrobium sp. TaxID=82 RepID=UPI0025C2E174|nr:hypothetical protein [Hyphomicrobium sp.]MCC7253271.1 hypothetical protein [Hyphomicrobium sp.]
MKEPIGREIAIDDGGVVALGPRMRAARESSLIELLETLGELNAWVGVIASVATSSRIQVVLPLVQHDLCHLCDQINLQSAAPLSRQHLARIDGAISRLVPDGIAIEEDLLPPGGPLPTAFAHLAWTVCKRARRQLASVLSLHGSRGASGSGAIADDVALIYLQRLGILLRIIGDIESR